MIARTPDEKRRLISQIKQAAPDMLEYFTECGKVFGKAKEVYYDEEPPGRCCRPGTQEAKHAKNRKAKR